MIVDSDPLLMVRIFLGLALAVAITLGICEGFAAFDRTRDRETSD